MSQLAYGQLGADIIPPAVPAGAAPDSKTYLLVANDAALPNARQFVAGTNITAADLGAGSTYTLSVVPPFTLTQPVSNAATPSPIFTATGGAHTALPAGVEAKDLYLNLGRTVQFAAGALALQRAIRIDGPTYGFVGASVVTAAATLAINKAPAAGANATLNYSTALLLGSADRTAEEANGITVDSLLGINHTTTAAGSGVFNTHQGLDVWYVSNPTGNTDDTFIGGSVVGSSAAGNTKNLGGLTLGLLGSFQHNGTGTATLSVGIRSSVFTNSTGGISEAHAFDGSVYHLATATIGVAKGFQWTTPYVPAGSTVTSSHGFYVAETGPFGGTFTGQTGVAVEPLTAATNNTYVLLGTGTIPAGQRLIYAVMNAPANLTASVENSSIFLDLSRTTTWATGAIATQREIQIKAPTYAFAGASIITDAATLAIDGPPAVGANATITRSHALLLGNNTPPYALTAPIQLLTVNHQTVDSTGLVTGGYVGVEGSNTVQSGKTMFGLYAAARTATTNTQGWSKVQGGQWQADHRGTGTITLLLGATAAAQNLGAGTVTSATAYTTGVNTQSTGGIGTAIGYNTSIGTASGGSSDTITTVVHYQAAATFKAGGAITNNVGFACAAQTVGTNNAHLLLGTTTPPTGQYLINATMPVAAANYTAGTENSSILLDLSRTVTFATGAITTQREVQVKAPTYAAAAASTITTAITMDISGAPIAGTNATLTNRIGLSVGSRSVAVFAGGTAIGALVDESYTDTAVHHYNFYSVIEANPTGATTKRYRAGQFIAQSNSANAQNFTVGGITAINALASHAGTGTLSILTGVTATASADNTGAVTLVQGVSAGAFAEAAGSSIATMYGVSSQVGIDVDGTITSAFAYNATALKVAGTITGIVGYATDNTFTVGANNTHVLLGTATIPTGNWALYSVVANPSSILGAVTIGANAAPVTSAILDLSSTTGALVVPRMTTAQKNLLTPTNGMIVYDSTLDKFQGYQAGSWQNLI